MRALHILQPIHLMDPNPQLPLLHNPEQIPRVMLEFLARHDVVHESRAHDARVVGS